MQTPRTLSPQSDTIPAELREGEQFVVWQWERRDGKWTKPPRSARTGDIASTTDAGTWVDFPTALAYASRHYAGRGGVGRVFAPDDPYSGVDLDKCRDPDTGEIEPWAREIIGDLDSYAEVSPSGTGVKITVRGSLPVSGRRTGNIEMYREGRYFTLTGHRLPDAPATVNERHDALNALYAHVFEGRGNDDTPPAPVTASGGARMRPTTDNVSDAELVALAMRAGNGEKFAGLWAGSTAGYPSRSEAVLALVSCIAFWAGPDETRIDRLFRQSGLMHDKWDTRHASDGRTYGQMTIHTALTGRTEFYEPGEGSEGYASEQGEGVAHGGDATVWTPPSPSWPAPLALAAFHGLLGEFVRLTRPHTEADDAALAVQFLVSAGSVIGRGPYVGVEADRHGLNLFGCLVGPSAKGRKGTSWGHNRRVWERVDPQWAGNRVADGVGSGEALIEEVRDPRVDPDTNEPVDPGVNDKRLMLLVPEFAGLLKVQGREGSTLSAVLRNAWDGGQLRVMTRRNPVKASETHISCVAHITRDELLRLSTDTDAANGLFNRWLWVAVRRSKTLPFGGDLAPEALNGLVTRLHKVVRFAATVGRISFGEDAAALWRAVYPELSEAKPGLLGAVTAGAEAQALRLAALYAVLDLSAVICREHLEAALAVWAYCEASARWVFGDKLGDGTADTILAALRGAGDAGMSRTEISALFGRNLAAGRLNLALTMLAEHGLTRCERSASGGRPTERWFAIGTNTKETKEDEESA